MIKITITNGVATELSIDGVRVRNCLAIDMHVDYGQKPIVIFACRTTDVEIEADDMDSVIMLKK